MKSTAKIFIWIGMIIQFYLIYPIIVGVIALKKIDESKTKSDLQLMGILTAILCSLLGGIFMLCIKDDELIEKERHIGQSADFLQCENNTSIKNDNGTGAKNFTILGSIIICCLLFGCLIFGIAALSNYQGESYVPFILTLISLALFISIIVFLNKNNYNLTAFNLTLLILFTFFAFLTMIMAIITNYELAYYEGYDYYYGEYSTMHIYGGAWEYWVIFGIFCVITILSVAILLCNKLPEKPSNNKVVDITKTIEQKSNTYNPTVSFEVELKEIKRIYEEELIDEEEYKKIRTVIISRYS